MTSKEKLMYFLTLFTSTSTLICCAIPALLVTLGFGAVLMGVVSSLPGLVWLSSQKIWIFSIGAGLLLLGGVLQWQARNSLCPIDPILAQSCKVTRKRSFYLYLFSLGIYAIGFTVSFILPKLI